MAGKVIFTWLDKSNEEASTTLYITPPANGAAYESLLTEAALMNAVIGALTLGTNKRYQIVTDVVDLSDALPASFYAQRESKWFVPFTNSGGGRGGHFTIPNAKLDGGLMTEGTQNADLSNVAWTNFLAQIEAAPWSPDQLPSGLYVIGQPYHVGRNT